MRIDKETSGLPVTSRSDARVTRSGRLLRKTKLDELPQLINVLFGQMSLVGPRPEDPRYVALYTPAQREILAFRPGITSPASIDYRDESLLFDGEDTERIYVERVLPHKLAIDLQYLRRATVASDVEVILRTLLSLVQKKKHPTGGMP
jgi:lipopolysaccharide/colanic/teichoic acid biosynthesis glycosyltransferase